MMVGFRYTHSADRRGFEVELNEYGRLLPHDPRVVSGVYGNHLGSGKDRCTTIRVLNVDSAASEETDMRMHAKLGPHQRLDVNGPAKSRGIDHALHSGSAHPHGIDRDSRQSPALG